MAAPMSALPEHGQKTFCPSQETAAVIVHSTLPNSPSSVLRLPFVAWDKSAGLAISFWQVFRGFCNF